jgi:putative endonuclease
MKGGWVYILANRYRGAMYVGVTAQLSRRIYDHRTGQGSQHASHRDTLKLVWAGHMPSILDAITHEKRLKRWRREWKFALIEEANPDWLDLYDQLHA